MRRITVWIRPHVQLLDVTGPIEVWSTASQVLEGRGRRPGYEVRTVAPGGGAVRTSAGLTLMPDGGSEGRVATAREADTLVVPGSFGDPMTPCEPALLRVLERWPGRVASVCAGAFRLAQAGRLSGRRATTHWLFTERLGQEFPDIDVEPDALWVRDGDAWTSAGVSAGIDLALAMVEADHGRAIAIEVARLLVLHMKRPGGQSQFSAVLAAQKAEQAPLRELLVWMHDHPHEDLRVPVLARRVAMSPRHFARVFTRETGSTPAAVVRRLRLAAARRMLEEDGRASLAQVAERSGHGTLESLRRAFVRHLGVAPGAYRDRFATAT